MRPGVGARIGMWWAAGRSGRRGGILGAWIVVQSGDRRDDKAGMEAMNADAATLWPRVAEGLRRDLGARPLEQLLKPRRLAD